MPTQDLDAVADRAVMVPMLPCSDVDAMAAFWGALGLTTTYRQLRPNPYISLQRGGIQLHYYGMPEWDPEASHSTCSLVVPDTLPVHEAFSAGLRELFGRVPLTGTPRMTRPRKRANNGGLSGFSLIDPAGNWVRVTRAPGDRVRLEATESGSTTWTSEAAGQLGRALENAVVIADSHGDAAQARKVLAGALRRSTAEPVPERARVLAYLVELTLRCGDPAAADALRHELDALPTDELGEQDSLVVATARAEAAELLRDR